MSYIPQTIALFFLVFWGYYAYTLHEGSDYPLFIDMAMGMIAALITMVLLIVFIAAAGTIIIGLV